MTTDLSSLPAPLVPREVNLQDFQYMELDVRRLRDSRFGAEVSGDAFRAGVMLWCASWHQVPAGSVPDDDVELANLAGYGRFVKEWKKERTQALQGFVKCNDGRLYHTVVCEKVNAAWRGRLEHFYERAKDRLRKANKARKDEDPPRPPLPELTFEQWNDRRLAGGIPMEKAEAFDGIPPKPPAEDPPISPEFQRKTLLEGEGEGKGEGEGEGKGEGEKRKDTLADPPADPGSDGKPFAPTKAGEIGQAFRRAGIPPTECNFADPVFAELLRQGATVEEFDGLAQEAKRKGIAHPWPWVLKTLVARRADAAQVRLAPPPPTADPGKAERIRRRLRGEAAAAPETFDV